MDWLDRAWPKSALLWAHLMLAAFDPLRGNPRFQAFVNAIRPSAAR